MNGEHLIIDRMSALQADCKCAKSKLDEATATATNKSHFKLFFVGFRTKPI